MKTLVKFIFLASAFLFSVHTGISQSASKVSVATSRPLFSNELLCMIAAIIVLLLLIILMPKSVKRTTRYYRDENGNVKSVTQTIIRGKKVQAE